MTTDDSLGAPRAGASGSCSGKTSATASARPVRLSSCHVRWSSADAAFVARSDQHPGLTYRDQWSSLAAIDGLLGVIERERSAEPGEGQSSGRCYAGTPAGQSGC